MIRNPPTGHFSCLGGCRAKDLWEGPITKVLRKGPVTKVLRKGPSQKYCEKGPSQKCCEKDPSQKCCKKDPSQQYSVFPLAQAEFFFDVHCLSLLLIRPPWPWTVKQCSR